MAAAQNATQPSTPASNAATWRDVEPAGVVLVSGPEEYLGIRAMDHVRAQVRAAAPDVEVTRLNAAAYEPGTLLMHVSPSLFGENKLIEVEGVEGMNDAFLADALDYLWPPGARRRPGPAARRRSPGEKAPRRRQSRAAGPWWTASP